MKNKISLVGNRLLLIGAILFSNYSTANCENYAAYLDRSKSTGDQCFFEFLAVAVTLFLIDRHADSVGISVKLNTPITSNRPFIFESDPEKFNKHTNATFDVDIHN